MEQYFELDQTVYHVIYGVGNVIAVEDNCEYPIFVRFKNDDDWQDITFTYDGREFSDEYICLSQNPIPKINNIPLIKKYIS